MWGFIQIARSAHCIGFLHNIPISVNNLLQKSEDFAPYTKILVCLLKTRKLQQRWLQTWTENIVEGVWVNATKRLNDFYRRNAWWTWLPIKFKFPPANSLHTVCTHIYRRKENSPFASWRTRWETLPLTFGATDSRSCKNRSRTTEGERSVYHELRVISLSDNETGIFSLQKKLVQTYYCRGIRRRRIKTGIKSNAPI